MKNTSFINKEQNSKMEQMRSKLNDFFFFFLQVFYSLDFGFFEYTSFKNKLVVNLLSFIQCIFVCIICLFCIVYSLEQSMAIASSLTTFDYFLQVLFLYLNKKDTFFYLQHVLNSIDIELGINKSYKKENQMFLVYLIAVLCKCILTVIYCAYSHKYCMKPTFTQIIFFIPLTGFDVPQIIHYFVFYSVYRRMKDFKKYVGESDNVVKCQYIYKTLINSTEKVKESFDILVS